MRSRWGLLGLAALACSAAGIQAARTPEQPRLTAGHAYAIPVVEGSAEFSLELPPGTHGLLILGSLSEFRESHRVHLHASSTTRPARGLEEVRPLRMRSPVARRPAVAATKTAKSTDKSHRRFFVHVADLPLDDPRAYTSLNARLQYESRRARVYADEEAQRLGTTAALAARVAQLLDERVLPTIDRRLGGVRDIDGDGKLSVLLTPWLERLQGGKTALKGFVRSTDFRSYSGPLSNHGDILYLSAVSDSGPALEPLLTHETTHLAVFSRRHIGEATEQAEEEDWLNEALAHVIETEATGDWSNLDYRIAKFLKQPSEAPLVVADYYRAGLWRDPGCRGATFLFLRWCLDQLGEQGAVELASSPQTGRGNLERTTGVPFPGLFRAWSLALWEASQAQDSADPTPSIAIAQPYRSLRLQGRLGTKTLHGLAVEAWDGQSPDRELTLRGSSLAYCELGNASSPRRITIECSREARLQATLVVLSGSVSRVAREER